MCHSNVGVFVAANLNRCMEDPEQDLIKGGQDLIKLADLKAQELKSQDLIKLAELKAQELIKVAEGKAATMELNASKVLILAVEKAMSLITAEGKL